MGLHALEGRDAGISRDKHSCGGHLAGRSRRCGTCRQMRCWVAQRCRPIPADGFQSGGGKMPTRLLLSYRQRLLSARAVICSVWAGASGEDSLLSLGDPVLE